MLLRSSSLRRLAAELRAQLWLWLQTCIAGACVTFLLWTAIHLLLQLARAPLAQALDELTPSLVTFGAVACGALLVVFVVRGLATGSASTWQDAEARARGATLWGFGAAIALAAGALCLALPARAEAPQAANADYCVRDLGTWFYCSRPIVPPGEKGSSEGEGEKPAEVEELEAFQKAVEEARLVAVWAPTEENVRRYYLLQKAALDKGGLFADQWRRLVWTNPEFDYTLKRPVSEVGKRAWEDERLYDRELFLKAAGPELGLFYVFRESCGACRVFAPIVRAFSGRYAVSVKAIAADGGRSPDFPSAVADKGQLRAMGFTSPATPALLIFQRASAKPIAVRVSNGKTLPLRPCAKPRGCVTYLGAGVMSVEDIAERMFVLLATRPGQDF